MTNEALTNAVQRLLTPLIRILIRYGVSFGEFRELAKQVYVDVGDSDFRLARRKQTIARIAMLTGIQRKEVSRLMNRDVSPDHRMDQAYNRGVRVISGWRHDADFTSEEGSPRKLPFEEGPHSFTELVRRYSGDLTARAVLDELERVGSITRNGGGLVQLTDETAYVPSKDKDAQFHIMGQSVGDLLATLDHNFEVIIDAPVSGPAGAAPLGSETRLQLTTAYDNLPGEAVTAFRQLSREEVHELLSRLDRWLAERDRDTNPEGQAASGDRYRAGIGVYYIEEKLKDEKT